MKGYKGYNNKFEIAEGLLNTPLETVKQMRKDPEFQKNNRLMQLIKMMIEGFKKWARIAAISIAKGLRPFAGLLNKDSVEPGYYDFTHTKEFEQLRDMVAEAVGIDKEYFNPEKREKYLVIADMIKNGEDPEQIKELELSPEGFFVNKATGKTYDVVGHDELEQIRAFATKGKYEGLEDSAWILMDNNTKGVVVDAGHPAVRAYLEKKYLGRDPEKGRKKEKEPEPEKPTVEVGDFIYELQDDNTAVLTGYTGKDEKTSVFYPVSDRDFTRVKCPVIPNEISNDGKIYPISGMTNSVFANTDKSLMPKMINMDAQYWQDKYRVAAFLLNEKDTIPINWTNPSPEQAQALKKQKEQMKQAEADKQKEPASDKQINYIKGMVLNKLQPAGYDIPDEVYQSMSKKQAQFILSVLTKDKTPEVIAQDAIQKFGKLLVKINPEPEMEPVNQSPQPPEREDRSKKKDRGFDI